ncbi:hypothetical protein C8244_04610 [Paracidovorax avenae]|nr:hypothetical protein C8237_04045 [Paracidovorax avenae]AVS98217.1 hypothetical protein C8236_04785 [Paracidovorax avenae]AVT15581.1 hypothetical protein C8244_04610 [Paracidovorax avenae]
MERQAPPRLKSAICFLLAAMIVAGLWQGTRPHLFHTAVSPYKAYRIEYYEASFLQGLIHPDFKMPGFVRLSRIQPNTLIGESKVVDLWMNGELYWYTEDPMNKVRVGRDVVFENVPPECAGCPPLPDSAVMP